MGESTSSERNTTLTVDDAIEAVTAAAWTVRQEGWDMEMNPVPKDAGRTLIHCRRTFGADWDLADAVDLIRRSTERKWVWDLCGHNLAVKDEDGWYRFEVAAPDELAPPLREEAAARRG